MKLFGLREKWFDLSGKLMKVCVWCDW